MGSGTRAVAVALCFLLAAAGSSAQDVKPSKQITKDLLPEDPESVKTRGIDVVPRHSASAETPGRPASGGGRSTLQVQFGFDSDALTEQAVRQLDELGESLSSPELEASRFTIIGHTDAKGARGYNQRLSELRASAVKRYLQDTYAIAPNRLDTIGRGEDQLLYPTEPGRGENRRVEVINLDTERE